MEHLVDVRPAPDTDAWARVALDRLSRVRDVQRVGLALTEGGGRRLHFTASDRASIEWCAIDAYDNVPLTSVVRSGRPVVGSLEELAARYPEFVRRQRTAGTKALAAIPLAAVGQVHGGYVLFYSCPQEFHRQQGTALESLGASLGAELRGLRLAAGPAGAFSDEPVPAGARAATYRVEADTRQIGRAREFLRRTLQDWDVDDDTIDTAVLCLSELVTNAVVHAGTGAKVRVVQDRGVLTTAVRDGGAAARVARLEDGARDDPLSVHGRGLRLVDALATRWGSEPDALGSTVWFVLDR